MGSDGCRWVWCRRVRADGVRVRLRGCSRGDDVTLRHSVLAAQDLLSSLWLASDAGDAREALASLTSLAAERIVTRIG